MVCFVPIVCLGIRKSCQRRDCSELGTVRNWVDHCTTDQTFPSEVVLRKVLLLPTPSSKFSLRSLFSVDLVVPG